MNSDKNNQKKKKNVSTQCCRSESSFFITDRNKGKDESLFAVPLLCDKEYFLFGICEEISIIQKILDDS